VTEATTTLTRAGSEIIGPGYHFKGTRAVLDEAERHVHERLRFKAVQTSAFDQHGSWARFTIAVLDHDDKVVREGWDVVELQPDGKIARVITFWGALPPKAP
jgi:hypothetical protein